MDDANKRTRGHPIRPHPGRSRHGPWRLLQDKPFSTATLQSRHEATSRQRHLTSSHSLPTSITCHSPPIVTGTPSSHAAVRYWRTFAAAGEIGSQEGAVSAASGAVFWSALRQSSPSSSLTAGFLVARCLSWRAVWHSKRQHRSLDRQV